MRFTLAALSFFLGACTIPSGLHPASMEVGAWGSESTGTADEYWNFDESAFGGHISFQFEFEYEPEIEDDAE